MKGRIDSRRARCESIYWLVNLGYFDGKAKATRTHVSLVKPNVHRWCSHLLSSKWDHLRASQLEKPLIDLRLEQLRRTWKLTALWWLVAVFDLPDIGRGWQLWCQWAKSGDGLKGRGVWRVGIWRTETEMSMRGEIVEMSIRKLPVRW